MDPASHIPPGETNRVFVILFSTTSALDIHTEDQPSSPSCADASSFPMMISSSPKYSITAVMSVLCWLCFVWGSGAACWKPPMFPLMNVNDLIISHWQPLLMSANVTHHVLKACLSPPGSSAACSHWSITTTQHGRRWNTFLFESGVSLSTPQKNLLLLKTLEVKHCFFLYFLCLITLKNSAPCNLLVEVQEAAHFVLLRQRYELFDAAILVASPLAFTVTFDTPTEVNTSKVSKKRYNLFFSSSAHKVSPLAASCCENVLKTWSVFCFV